MSERGDELARQRPVPVTVEEAARRLDVAKGTIYSWVTRYRAQRVGTVGRRTYYDFNDLAVIDGAIAAGRPVPGHDDRVSGAV